MLPISIHFCPKTDSHVDSTGYPVDTGNFPHTAITVDALLKVTLFEDEGGIVPYTGFAGCTAFAASFDYNFDHDIDPCIRVLDADINVAGDWASVDFANGLISIRMNFDVTALIAWATADETEQMTTGQVEIQGFTAGKLAGFVRFPFYIDNLQDYTSTPVAVPDDYYTDDETDALLSPKLDKESAVDLVFTGPTLGVQWVIDETHTVKVTGYMDGAVPTIDVNEV